MNIKELNAITSNDDNVIAISLALNAPGYGAGLSSAHVTDWAKDIVASGLVGDFWNKAEDLMNETA